MNGRLILACVVAVSLVFLTCEDDKIDDLDMVFVEGGTFMMGCTPEQGDDCGDEERPAHSVTVSDFSIMKYEVTQRLWERLMGSNPSAFKGKTRPVEDVSWDDVQEFIKKLNNALGKNYRLPTEAEWEFAARGGTKSQGYKYAGSNDIDEVAWYFGNSGDKALADGEWDMNKSIKNNNRTHPVGTKKPNELGIHDMTGNVWEWVNDWHGEYTEISKTNPTGPEQGLYRVFRGGSFEGETGALSCRSYTNPHFSNYFIGFRLALSP